MFTLTHPSGTDPLPPTAHMGSRLALIFTKIIVQHPGQILCWRISVELPGCELSRQEIERDSVSSNIGIYSAFLSSQKKVSISWFAEQGKVAMEVTKDVEGLGFKQNYKAPKYGEN